MTITLTVTGDTISPEIANMLQSLGIALSNQKQSVPVNESPKIEHEPEPELLPVQTVKRTRIKKEVEPEAAKPEPVEEPKTNISLESLREKAVVVLKAGKSGEFKAILEEFGYKSLSEAKKADFEALNVKISAL